LGDDTARRLGRVSFNPLKHIDPIGTILLPGLLLFVRSPFLFGYAKPVPVNFRALHNPRANVWSASSRSA
jgi:Zn-dependent protease